MKRSRVALGVASLGLVCGLGSLGSVGYAQDDGIFNRDRDRGIFDSDRPLFERDRDRSGLPRGATLLGSGDAECQGALLASGLGRDGTDVYGIREGEEQVLEVADLSVPWACLGENTARSDVMECPRGTTDIRISHEGNIARFECYGTRE